MTIASALVSSFCSAANLLTQRVATRRVDRGSFWRVAAYLARSPLWLTGVAMAVAAFAFQALALRDGQLSVVQPVLVTELVFVLVLRWLWLRERPRRAAWMSACLTCVGLGAFLVVAEPRGGDPVPTDSAWLLSLGVAGGASVLLSVLAAHGSPVRRAALYATAAAIVAALEAALIKTATHTLTVDGLPTLATQWPAYALAVAAIVDTVLVQAALHVGPLTISQPLMVVVNPLVSIALSVVLFDEYFTGNALSLLIAVCSFATMSVGVVWQTKTQPRQQLASA